MPRKHLIASGINKKQQHQAKLWMKCAKEIKAATKIGGTNPDSNPRLKRAIIKALDCNLSRDSIDKNINGANKDASTFKEMYFEGYGPSGIAILINSLTDNEMRTISSIRGYFSKIKGQLAKPNSVKILFKEFSEFVIDKEKYSEDQIFESTVDLNVLDLKDEEDVWVLMLSPQDFLITKSTLESSNIEYLTANIKYIPNETVDLPEEIKLVFERFIQNCEDDDDIQWVVSNCKEQI